MKCWLGFALLHLLVVTGRSQGIDESLHRNFFKNDPLFVELNDSLILPGEGTPRSQLNDSIVHHGFRGRFQHAVDSLQNKHKNVLKTKSKISGELNVGVAYGGLNIVNNEAYTHPIYFSEGAVRLSTLAIPLDVRYYISDVGFKGGRANNFSVRLDVQELKRRRSIQFAHKTNVLSQRIDSLNHAMSLLDQKLAFEEFQHKKMEQQWLHNKADGFMDPSNQQLTNGVTQFNDRLMAKPDSLAGLEQTQLPDADSTWVAQEQAYRDRVLALQQSKGEVLSQLDTLQKHKEQLKNLKGKPAEWMSIGKTKWSIPAVKSMAIGNVAPAISTFTLENTRLLGASITLENTHTHIDIVAGKLAPLFPANQSPQPWDRFRQMVDARTGHVWLVRGGYGSSAKSHLYISYMSGIANGWAQSENIQMNGPQSSKNLELEGMLGTLDRGITVNYAYRLNAIQNDAENNTASESNRSPWMSAYAAKGNYDLKKIAIKISGEGQLIGPSYFSVGNPFLRSDQALANTKVGWTKWKWLQPSLSARAQRNNVFQQLTTTHSLQSLTYEVVSKPTQRLQVRASYSPVQITIRSADSLSVQKTNAYSCSVFHSVQKTEYTLQSTAAWNRTVQLWNAAVVTSEMVNGNIQSLFGSGLQLSAGTSYTQFDMDTLSTAIMQLEAGIGFSKKELQVNCTGSIGRDGQGNEQVGAQASVQWLFTKHVSLVCNATRFPQFTVQNELLTQNLTIPYLMECRLKWTL